MSSYGGTMTGEPWGGNARSGPRPWEASGSDQSRGGYSRGNSDWSSSRGAWADSRDYRSERSQDNGWYSNTNGRVRDNDAAGREPQRWDSGSGDRAWGNHQRDWQGSQDTAARDGGSWSGWGGGRGSDQQQERQQPQAQTQQWSRGGTDSWDSRGTNGHTSHERWDRGTYGRTCHKCGKEGHLARECTERVIDEGFSTEIEAVDFESLHLSPLIKETGDPACAGDSWSAMRLPGWLETAVSKFETPTRIQSEVIPPALRGNDLVGIAQTGSGKTIAFLVPAILHVGANPRGTTTREGPAVLVLAPTRELVVQIKEQADLFEKSEFPLCTTSIFGGSRELQLKYSVDFSKPMDIGVASPGRLIDYLQQKKFNLQRVGLFVLDEGDRMLDMGFSGAVESISAQIRPDRQTMFFSATWPDSVRNAAEVLCHSGTPLKISVNSSEQATANTRVEQTVIVAQDAWSSDYVADKEQRFEEFLLQSLEQRDAKILVFVSTKAFADKLVDKLKEQRHWAAAIHGNKKQSDRQWNLDQFKSGRLNVLVATDVVARGIDISDVTHVINFDMPNCIDDYVHRIGRTARGVTAVGKAITFIDRYVVEQYPSLIQELIDVLVTAGQPVPPELSRIVSQITDAKSPASAAELGEWYNEKSGRWDYFANDRRSGFFELCSGGNLRFQWGSGKEQWAKWRLVGGDLALEWFGYEETMRREGLHRAISVSVNKDGEEHTPSGSAKRSW